MMTRITFLVVALLSFGAISQDKGCETKCNQDGSDCLKACSAPKEGAADAKLMMHCLKHCEVKTKACKQSCSK